MRPAFRRLFALPAACLLCAYAAAAAVEEPPPDDDGNAVAMRVNAQAFGVREIETLMQDSYSLINEKIRRGELKPELKADAVREAWKSALQTAIQDYLLDELGRKFRQEIKLRIVSQYSPSTANSRIEDAYKRWEGDMVDHLRKDMIKEAGDEQALRETLAKRGQTWRQWEQGLILEIYRREVLFYSLGPVHDSMAAAKKYYEDHPEDFGHPDAWQLRRIRIPKAKFSTPEEAAQTADLIYKKVSENGVDFAEASAALKYDPTTDPRGGLLTVDGKTGLPSGNFPAEERIAKNLKDGQIAKPVDAGDAYLIVKREGYRAAEKLSWEDAAQRAHGLSFAETLRKKKQEFFEKQKNDAYIEILQKEPPPRWLK